MAVWSEMTFLSCGDVLRLDAEYYKPEYLKYADVISTGDLLESTAKIIHPTEIKRVYEKEGIQILLAQNVRKNHLDFSSMAFMPVSSKAKLYRNKIKLNDVLMTRTGANFGDSAVYKGEPEEIYACADVLIIRPKGVPGGYLSTYFNTKIGRALITRGAYGMAQPHISPSYLYTMRLFRCEDDFEREIDNLVGEAYARENESKALYAEAKSILLRGLGLDSLDLSPKIAHSANFSEAAKVHRLDAEYWGYQYAELVDHLKEIPHDTLAQLAGFSNGATPRGAEYLNSGVSFLRIQNIGENRLNLDDVVYIDKITHDKLLRRSQLRPGDVLITITGRIGTSAVVPKNMPTGNINQHIVRLRLKCSDTNPYYVSTFLNSILGRLQTEREAYGTTREALPYYCLERVIVPKASENLKNKIEQKILAAENSLNEAKILLEKAKNNLEKMMLSGGTLKNECPQ